MNKKIQVLRGLAITAVVMIHSHPQTFVGIIIRAFINYAVALFVFCSGYLTKTEYKDISRFYVKRIERVGIPYIIWSLVFTAVYAIRYGKTENLITSTIVNILLGKTNGIMYFIPVYIGLVLLTPLIGKLLKSKWWWTGLWISPVYMIVTTYLPKVFDIQIIPSSIAGILCFKWFIFYYIGMAFGNSIIEPRVSNRKAILIWEITIFISICEGLIWNYYGDYQMATTQSRLSCMLSSSAVSVLAYYYLKSNRYDGFSRFEKILSIIGDYSFGIYLSHLLMMGVLRRIPGYETLIFPFKSLATVLFATIVLHLVDKACAGKLNGILGIR